jgi:hypothetical protein
MKHLKLFENFTSRETEFNKFRGIDISDVNSFSFIWSTAPHISSYKGTDDKYGSAEKRIDIYHTIKNIILDSGVTKEQFKDILEKNFEVSSSSTGYHVDLKGQDVIVFFEILQNINSYI